MKNLFILIISSLVSFLGCGEYRSIPSLPSIQAPSKDSFNPDMSKPTPFDMTSRLLLLENTKDFDIYYDSVLKASCVISSFPFEATKRCFPLMQLTNIGCLNKNGNDLAFTRETGYWNGSYLENRYKDVPFYRGERAGRYSFPFTYYSFDTEDFQMVSYNFSGTDTCNVTGSSRTVWCLRKPRKLEAFEFAVVP